MILCITHDTTNINNISCCDRLNFITNYCDILGIQPPSLLKATSFSFKHHNTSKVVYQFSDHYLFVCELQFDSREKKLVMAITLPTCMIRSYPMSILIEKVNKIHASHINKIYYNIYCISVWIKRVK